MQQKITNTNTSYMPSIPLGGQNISFPESHSLAATTQFLHLASLLEAAFAFNPDWPCSEQAVLEHTRASFDLRLPGV